MGLYVNRLSKTQSLSGCSATPTASRTPYAHLAGGFDHLAGDFGRRAAPTAVPHVAQTATMQWGRNAPPTDQRLCDLLSPHGSGPTLLVGVTVKRVTHLAGGLDWREERGSPPLLGVYGNTLAGRAGPDTRPCWTLWCWPAQAMRTTKLAARRERGGGIRGDHHHATAPPYIRYGR